MSLLTTLEAVERLFEVCSSKTPAHFIIKIHSTVGLSNCFLSLSEAYYATTHVITWLSTNNMSLKMKINLTRVSKSGCVPYRL